METGAKIAIVIMIMVVVVAVSLAYMQLGYIEDLTAFNIREDMINCIEHYRYTSSCVEICEGIHNDTTYLFLKELSVEKCRPYIAELMERLNL
jgi:hypothetical protein